MTRETRNILLYSSPFAVWIGLQTILPATACAYAVRTIATGLVLGAWCLASNTRKLLFADSRRFTVTSAFVGMFGGLLVLALWILPEFSDCYRTWCCWPIGRLPAIPAEPSPYSPATCGWTLTAIKLIGSAFVIAPAEELFFRSFLYRWLQRRDFISVPLAHFELSALLWTIFLFTLEHDRPLAAAAAGAVYGLLAIRFGIAAAIIAHVATNLLLGIYVIHFNQWAFW